MLSSSVCSQVFYINEDQSFSQKKKKLFSIVINISSTSNPPINIVVHRKLNQ